MFRRGEVWSRQGKAAPQATTTPKQHEDSAEKDKVTNSRLRYWGGEDKYGKQTPNNNK